MPMAKGKACACNANSMESQGMLGFGCQSYGGSWCDMLQ